MTTTALPDSGPNAVTSNIAQSTGGRVALPPKSGRTQQRTVIPQRVNAADTDNDDIAGNNNAYTSLCLVVASNLPLFAFQPTDLEWLGRLAAYLKARRSSSSSQMNTRKKNREKAPSASSFLSARPFKKGVGNSLDEGGQHRPGHFLGRSIVCTAIFCTFRDRATTTHSVSVLCRRSPFASNDKVQLTRTLGR
jgi:hypothetical protein